MSRYRGGRSATDGRGRGRRLAGLAVAAVAALVASLAMGPPAHGQDPEQTARLVNIRHGDFGGRDRIVFDFFGPLPSHTTARYVSRVISDPSGAVAPVRGNAFIELVMHQAHGVDPVNHRRTYPETRPAFGLPNAVHAVNTGDFEDVMSFGIGVMQRAPFTVTTLTDPSRVVVDIDRPFTGRTVRAYYQDLFAFQEGRWPDTRSVPRTVPASSHAETVARNALLRLYAHPTGAEKAAGLRLVPSRSTGFADLSISTGQVARVRLTGGCSSGGSTYTIANQIMPTLKQFASVRWVKIYDPSGRTQAHTGQRDSVPACLEP